MKAPQSERSSLGVESFAGRRTRWQRLKRPASYWPTRYTREVPIWHPWHVGAAVARLRFWYLRKRGY